MIRVNRAMYTSLATVGIVWICPHALSQICPDWQALRLENTPSSTEYIRIADSPGLEPQQFTIECWISPRGSGDGNSNNLPGAAFLMKSVEGGGGGYLASWWLQWSPVDQRVVAGTAHLVPAPGVEFRSATPAPLNAWTHVALTCDGSTLRLYVNGTLDNIAAFAFPSVYYGPEDVLIGAANHCCGYTRRYDGLIDDVRIWNHARSAAQIAAGMSCEVSPQTGLLGAWHFTNGSLEDISGNGHDGVAVGAVSYEPQPATYDTPVLIESQPTPVTINAGQNANFAMTTNTLCGATFAWRRNGIPLSDGPTGNGSTVAGAATTSPSITNAQPADAGSYDCVVTDQCGTTECQDAALIINAANCASVSFGTNTSTCYDAGHTTLIVDVDLDSACANIVGGQFYLSYDTSKLDLAPAGIAVGQTPFNQLVLANVDDASGTADVAVSVAPGNPGASSGRMARLTFTITDDVCTPTADLVSFRSHTPPTRVVDIAENPYDVENAELVVAALPAISADIHPPTITDPGNLNLECGPSNAAAITAWLATPVASDGCGVVSFNNDYTALSNLCGNTGTATVTWTASDNCGNTMTRIRTVTVTDTTPPSFSLVPANLVLECAAPGNTVGINAWLASAAATDACGSATVVHNYTGLTPGTCAGTGNATVTWSATDECGLQATHVATIQVLDTTAPVFTNAVAGVLPPINTIADAGICTATVSLPTPTVVESCDASFTLVGVRNDSLALNAPYPSTAPTTITWTATDCAGNSTVATQVVTVAAFNEIDVAVAYNGGGFAASFVRCIRFEIFPSSCAAPVVVEQSLTFSAGAATTVVQVPCGSYACITARDVKHSLRRTDIDNFGTSPIVGLRYAADFTNRTGVGGDNDALIVGNYHQDGNEYRFIDILDLATLLARFGTTPPVNTACGFVGRHADGNGDGSVGLIDLTLLLSAFGQVQEANCCALSTFTGDNPIEGGEDSLPQDGQATAAATGELVIDVEDARNAARPRTSITVAELIALGLSELTTADLNGDGVVDLQDVGALPEGTLETKAPAQIRTPRR